MDKTPNSNKKVTVCIISDTHRTHEDLTIPEVDLLIHCGDYTGINSLEELHGLNDWFGKQPTKKVLFVPGNHDEIFENNEKYARSFMTNATVLIDEFVEVDGLKIYGIPWVPTFFDWSFMKPDLNLQKHWNKIPPGLDILITHGPPYSILDKNSQGQMCGSQTLYMHIAKMEKAPKVHCFGHIHEGRGEKVIEDTRFINAACCPVWTSDGYKEFEPIIIEI